MGAIGAILYRRLRLHSRASGPRPATSAARRGEEKREQDGHRRSLRKRCGRSRVAFFYAVLHPRCRWTDRPGRRTRAGPAREITARRNWALPVCRCPGCFPGSRSYRNIPRGIETARRRASRSYRSRRPASAIGTSGCRRNMPSRRTGRFRRRLRRELRLREPILTSIERGDPVRISRH